MKFLKLHHVRSKWKRRVPNLQVGDIVGVLESTLSHRRIPIAVVAQTYPGSDGLVRVVDVRWISSSC